MGEILVPDQRNMMCQKRAPKFDFSEALPLMYNSNFGDCRKENFIGKNMVGLNVSDAITSIQRFMTIIILILCRAAWSVSFVPET